MAEAPGRDVLVVIPCLNEEAHLPGLLESILAGCEEALVVVADGGSRDRSREIVQEMARSHANLRLLDNPGKIQSKGVNLAARLHGGAKRWLVRIDAHCDYPAGYLSRLLDAARQNDATSVVVPMVSVGRGCFQIAAATAQNSVLGTGGSAHRHLSKGQWVDHGHHALFDLPLYLAVGGYDENFAFNEDAELDRRLLDAGGRIWLEPAAAISYYPRRTPAALFRQYRNYGSGRARNLRRHRMPMRLRQMLPLAVAPAIFAGICGLALGQVWAPAALIALPMLAWLGAAVVAGAVLGLREGGRCAALSGVAAAIMHAAWSAGYWREMLGAGVLPPLPEPLETEPVG